MNHREAHLQSYYATKEHENLKKVFQEKHYLPDDAKTWPAEMIELFLKEKRILVNLITTAQNILKG